MFNSANAQYNAQYFHLNCIFTNNFLNNLSTDLSGYNFAWSGCLSAGLHPKFTIAPNGETISEEAIVQYFNSNIKYCSSSELIKKDTLKTVELLTRHVYKNLTTSTSSSSSTCSIDSTIQPLDHIKNKIKNLRVYGFNQILANTFRDSESADIHIKCRDGVVIPAHSHVLKNYPWFAEKNNIEANNLAKDQIKSDKAFELDLSEFPQEAVASLLRILYCANEKEFNIHELIWINWLANYLDLTDIKEYSLELIDTFITTNLKQMVPLIIWVLKEILKNKPSSSLDPEEYSNKRLKWLSFRPSQELFTFLSIYNQDLELCNYPLSQQEELFQLLSELATPDDVLAMTELAEFYRCMHFKFDFRRSFPMKLKYSSTEKNFENEIKLAFDLTQKASTKDPRGHAMWQLSNYFTDMHDIYFSHWVEHSWVQSKNIRPVEVDFIKAKEIFKEAVKMGCPQARVLLEELYSPEKLKGVFIVSKLIHWNKELPTEDEKQAYFSQEALREIKPYYVNRELLWNRYKWYAEGKNGFKKNKTLATWYCFQAALKNKSDAFFQIGRRGIVEDRLEWYNKAKSLGHIEAEYQIAFNNYILSGNLDEIEDLAHRSHCGASYIMGSTSSRNNRYQEAIDWLDNGNDIGDECNCKNCLESQILLAQIYSNSNSGHMDLERVAEIWIGLKEFELETARLQVRFNNLEKLVKLEFLKDNSKLNAAIGECYQDGLGIGQNSQLAFSYYQHAVKVAEPDPKAFYLMGKCYEEGLPGHLEVNHTLAIDYYEKASEYDEDSYGDLVDERLEELRSKKRKVEPSSSSTSSSTSSAQ